MSEIPSWLEMPEKDSGEPEIEVKLHINPGSIEHLDPDAQVLFKDMQGWTSGELDSLISLRDRVSKDLVERIISPKPPAESQDQ